MVPEGCFVIQVTLGSHLNFVVSHHVHYEDVLGYMLICWSEVMVTEKEGEE